MRGDCGGNLEMWSFDFNKKVFFLLKYLALFLWYIKRISFQLPKSDQGILSFIAFIFTAISLTIIRNFTTMLIVFLVFQQTPHGLGKHSSGNGFPN
mgnify:CR=1 FL=1